MIITLNTVPYRYKQNHSEIRDALKKGKEVVDYQVENALLNKALNGDTTAQIFWLKNRKPDKWRDKPVVDADREALEKLDALLGDFKNAVKQEAD